MKSVFAQLSRPLRLAPTVVAMLTFSSLFASLAQAQQSSQTQSQTAQIPSSNTLQMPAPTAKPWTYGLKYEFIAGLDGVEYQDEQQQLQEIQTRAFIKMLYTPATFVDFNLYGGFILDSAHSQFRYNEPSTQHGVLAREGTIELHPFNTGLFNGTLSFGAVWLDNYMPLNVVYYEDTFPGLREIISYGTKDQYVKLFAGQFIPTSASFSTQTTETEATPWFFIEGLDGKTPITKYFALEGFGGHYKYSDLPSAVAMNSGLSGNTIHDTGPNSSKFAYGFDGYFGGGGFDINFNSKYKFTLRDTIAYNADAPESSNMGQILKGGFELHFNPNLVIIPWASYYFNESDTSPAAFNDGEMGHNNVRGYGAGVKVKFPQSHFWFMVTYYDFNLINPSATQFAGQFFDLRIMTDYGNASLF